MNQYYGRPAANRFFAAGNSVIGENPGWPAIAANAAAIILLHNHPSGEPTPSEADIKVTRDLIRAGQLLKIEVLDHVILGRATQERPKDYMSLRELGYFAGC